MDVGFQDWNRTNIVIFKKCELIREMLLNMCQRQPLQKESRVEDNIKKPRRGYRRLSQRHQGDNPDQKTAQISYIDSLRGNYYEGEIVGAYERASQFVTPIGAVNMRNVYGHAYRREEEPSTDSLTQICYRWSFEYLELAGRSSSVSKQKRKSPVQLRETVQRHPLWIEERRPVNMEASDFYERWWDTTLTSARGRSSRRL